MNAIGLDFGTNYCRAVSWAGERPNLIPSATQEPETPTWIKRTPEGQFVVGRQAGCATYSPANLPFVGVKKGLATRQDVWLGGKMLTPREITTVLFQSLRADAERVLKVPVTTAVITIPALAGNLQRANTRQAAEMAGFAAVRLLNEPTAAAMGQGIQNGRFLIYTLGAGSYEVAILEVNNQVFKTLWTEGDLQLGGNAFDKEIVHHLLLKIQHQFHIDLASDSRALWLLAQAAEKSKIDLSIAQHTHINIPRLWQNSRGEYLSIEMELTQREVNDLLRQPIEQTVTLAQQALAKTNLTPKDIDTFWLVGGSTRLPLIQEMLQTAFRRELTVLPLSAAATGAAKQAISLAQETPAPILPSAPLPQKIVSPTPIPHPTPPPNRSPAAPDPHYLLDEAVREIQHEQYEQAIKHLKALEQLGWMREETVREWTISAYYGRGMQLQKASAMEEAIHLFEEAVKKFPQNKKLIEGLAGACYIWGEQLEKKGQYAEALAVVEKGVRWVAGSHHDLEKARNRLRKRLEQYQLRHGKPKRK